MLPIFDAHCDTVHRLITTGESLKTNRGHIDLSRRPAKYAQFFALWGHSYEKMMALLRSEAKKNADDIVICKTVSDMENAWENNRLAGFISVEGAEMIDCRTERLDDIYADGVRMIGLTWNHANALCGSCKEKPGRGLTKEGHKFVKRAFELGMIVDLSHAGDAAADDTLSMAKEYGRPVVFSHSNSRTICCHQRNAADSQFKQIVELGGVAGLNLFSYFINGKAESTWHDAVPHLEHWLDLGGENSIALGADWDGCDINGKIAIVNNAEGIDKLSGLYDILIQRNWTEKTLCKLFYENMKRVVEQCITSVQEIQP
jgi:membrane dipeptidase